MVLGWLGFLTCWWLLGRGFGTTFLLLFLRHRLLGFGWLLLCRYLFLSRCLLLFPNRFLLLWGSLLSLFYWLFRWLFCRLLLLGLLLRLLLRFLAFLWLALFLRLLRRCFCVLFLNGFLERVHRTITRLMIPHVLLLLSICQFLYRLGLFLLLWDYLGCLFNLL